MRAGSRQGLTLVEALVGLALMSAALVLVLDAMAGAAGTSASRLQRTGEMTQTVRAAEVIGWDLDRAVVTEDGPRVTLEGRGIVVPVRETAGAPVSIWYRFDATTGVLERGHPTRGYERVGAVPLERVRWDVTAGPAATGAVAVSVHLAPRLAARDASRPATPSTTRAIECVTARVVEPAACGVPPEGWLEPSRDPDE